MKISWTDRASRDTIAIYAYIAEQSDRYADAVFERILHRPLQLVDNPESGAIVPKYNRPDIREVFVHSFRLIYKILPNEILVLTGCGLDGFASGLMPEAKFVVGA